MMMMMKSDLSQLSERGDSRRERRTVWLKVSKAAVMSKKWRMLR